MFMSTLYGLIPSDVIETIESLRRMRKRQFLLQLFSFANFLLVALMVWKGWCVLMNNESPVVVVLSESMSPGFERGDILFLNMYRKDPIVAGDITVFKLKDRDIPIVHRVLKLHEERDTGAVKVLTKGDNNDTHDRGLYNRGQKWLAANDVVGRTKVFLPYLGFPTILMNDYPPLKYLMIGLMGILVIVAREE